VSAFTVVSPRTPGKRKLVALKIWSNP
jgi:hypothetical protein